MGKIKPGNKSMKLDIFDSDTTEIINHIITEGIKEKKFTIKEIIIHKALIS